MSGNLNKLRPIKELSETNDFCYEAATLAASPEKFIELAIRWIPRYAGNSELAAKEMRLLYSHLGKEWYQRARQAEALQKLAAMLDRGMEEGPAVSAALHWAEICFRER